MNSEVKNAFEVILEYFAVQLNPAQMDDFAGVLVGIIENSNESAVMVKRRNDENIFDELVELAVTVAEISFLLKKLNEIKLGICGKGLTLS